MMSFLGLLHFLVIIAFATFTNATLSSTSSADTGGNRGFGLGFNDVNQYAAVSDYFPTADYWPTYNMTGSIFFIVFAAFDNFFLSIKFLPGYDLQDYQ